MNAQLITCQAVEAPKQAGEVVIMPWGEFEVNGRRVRFTEESIPLIQAAIAAKGVEIPLDYDHGMSTNPPANGIAPAAGWIKQLALQAGEPMRAAVEWTPQAAREVASKQFRYLSPTFWARPDDGVVIGLHSVALTNKPAIAHMPPIAARDASASAACAAAERIAAMKTIAQCLGLAAEANEDQITAKCKELLAAAEQVQPLRAAVAAFAGEIGDDALATLAADGRPELLSASLKTVGLKLKNPPGMVAIADYELLAAKVRTLEAEQVKQQCAALIAAHDKKLPPAKRAWFEKFYAADAVAAQEWIEQAPELVATSGATPPAGGGSDRQAIIVAARAKWASEPDLAKVCESERVFVNGKVLAAGMAKLTDDEAAKLGL